MADASGIGSHRDTRGVDRGVVPGSIGGAGGVLVSVMMILGSEGIVFVGVAILSIGVIGVGASDHPIFIGVDAVIVICGVIASGSSCTGGFGLFWGRISSNSDI